MIKAAVLIIAIISLLPLISSTPQEFGISVCYDRCDFFQKAFTVYESPLKVLAYSWDNAALSGEVILPDGSLRALLFHQGEAVFPSGVEGGYNVTVSAEWPYGSSETRNLSIKVYARMPEAVSLDICNSNGVCDGNESFYNCPPDCKDVVPAKNTGALQQNKETEVSATGGIDYLLIAIVIVIISIAALVIRSRK